MLTLKQESLCVHKYGLKFTHLSRYAPDMVKDMKRKMGLFVGCLGRVSNIKGKEEMLIGNMDISRLMGYVQHVED